jgi:hypothetical protein
MTHLEVENLASEYLEGLLEAARKGEMEAHLAECAPCRELVAEVRGVMELCREAEDLEPAPWLISKILLATVGARKPTLGEQLAALLRPAIQPRFVYAMAMAVFSFSIIVNAAGVNLRNVRIGDLNPRTWIRHANLAGHQLAARAEKFYYDLRIVIEIESRFRQLGAQPQPQEKEAPRQQPPAGGSSDTKQPGNPQLAANPDLFLAAFSVAETVPSPTGNVTQPRRAGRSQSQ